MELSVEKQFKIRSFNEQVDSMSEAQAKVFLKMTHQQMVVQEATYNELLKPQWGIGGVLPEVLG
ncbi:MAG: NblA/ycf18 family protein [Rhizonema sp. NSF051]|nr:NblA/ycf18 family protein [Rhizonema sp. NSF051]